jgi:hypothetical protein
MSEKQQKFIPCFQWVKGLGFYGWGLSGHNTSKHHLFNTWDDKV